MFGVGGGEMVVLRGKYNYYGMRWSRRERRKEVRKEVKKKGIEKERNKKSGMNNGREIVNATTH